MRETCGWSWAESGLGEGDLWVGGVRGGVRTR